MTTMVPEDAPKPRQCHVKKWEDFTGYGFNLHAEKGKAGQYIGKVDDNSPGKLAGMKEGDRIVEVNGVNISNENHQQVVTRIKHDPNATTMLLVDTDTDNYYKEHKIVIRGDMANVLCITCPDTSDGTPTVVEGAGDGGGAESPAPSTPSTVESAPRPRRCHIKIWPDFQGYGFNLHAEKGKPGQFIGKVDEASPAEVGGLKEGDRILEVNGESVAQDSHQQVVEQIKARVNETELLVVDPQTDTYYKDRGVVVVGTMDEVQNIVCPDTRPTATANGSAAQVEAEVNHQDAQVDDDDLGDYETPDSAAIVGSAAAEQAEAQTVENVEESSAEAEDVPVENPAVADSPRDDVDTANEDVDMYAVPHREREPQEQVNGEAEVAAALSEVDQAVEDEEKRDEDDIDATYEQVVIEDTPSKAEPDVSAVAAAAVVTDQQEREDEPVTPTSPGPVTVGGIEFAGSIEEAKQRASRKKKKDPRMQQQLSMKDKYDLFMKM